MAAKRSDVEPEEPSRAAGACVLVVLGGVVAAVVFAVSPTAGVLAVWVVGAALLWRSARRPVRHVSAPTPPPGEERPTCSECAGHTLVSATPLGGQKGMLIYKSASPDRPNHTHIHVAQGD